MSHTEIALLCGWLASVAWIAWSEVLQRKRDKAIRALLSEAKQHARDEMVSRFAQQDESLSKSIASTELSQQRVLGGLDALVHLANTLGDDLRAETKEREELARQLQAARDSHRFELECMAKDVNVRLDKAQAPLLGPDLTDEELGEVIFKLHDDADKVHDLGLQRRVVANKLRLHLGQKSICFGARHEAAIARHVTMPDETPPGRSP